MANIYSVCQVNNYIKNMFAQDYMLGHVYIKGELSNVKYHSSGHIYFTLKDESAAISAVMFAGNRKGLNFKLEEGQNVIVLGSVEVYARDGKYQVYASKIELAGIGDLKEKFEKLKRKLEEMGMFSKEYKRPIPKYIKKLGVVTAPTGAAIQDIINITTRRNPYVQIVLFPALVQGDGAAESIIRGINALEEYGVDVIIVGRGGGSIEDLWCFNDEMLAHAIFNCSVPVISAVGHEIDYTIADYVADLRAPTPSAAAELAVYEHEGLLNDINDYEYRLRNGFFHFLERYRLELENRRLKIENLSPQSLINEKRMRIVALEERLNALMNESLTEKRHKFLIYAERLKGLSPIDKLSQGYAHVKNGQGETVTDYKQVNKGDLITIHVRNGEICAEVKGTSAQYDNSY